MTERLRLQGCTARTAHHSLFDCFLYTPNLETGYKLGGRDGQGERSRPVLLGRSARQARAAPHGPFIAPLPGFFCIPTSPRFHTQPRPWTRTGIIVPLGHIPGCNHCQSNPAQNEAVTASQSRTEPNQNQKSSSKPRLKLRPSAAKPRPTACQTVCRASVWDATPDDCCLLDCLLQVAAATCYGPINTARPLLLMFTSTFGSSNAHTLVDLVCSLPLTLDPS